MDSGRLAYCISRARWRGPPTTTPTCRFNTNTYAILSGSSDPPNTRASLILPSTDCGLLAKMPLRRSVCSVILRIIGFRRYIPSVLNIIIIIFCSGFDSSPYVRDLFRVDLLSTYFLDVSRLIGSKFADDKTHRLFDYERNFTIRYFYVSVKSDRRTKF